MRAFTQAEFDTRMGNVRKVMAERNFDACIITNPENVYYLTGLNHQGYFAYTSLILPLERDPVLITRAMEHAIVRDMTPGLQHVTYSDGIRPLPNAKEPEHDITMMGQPGERPDGQPPLAGSPDDRGGLHPWSMSIGVSIRSGDEDDAVDYDAPVESTCQALKDLGLSSARVGFERSSSFLPYRIADGFVSKMSDITWLGADDIVNDVRMVQSKTELAYSRRAAEISDAMVMAGTAVAGAGVLKQDVMACIYQVMFQRGGTYPAFVPLVRSTHTLGHEHGTWDARRLKRQDLLFLEMAGCHWRYHAPIGRLVYIGKAGRKSERIYKVALDALHAAKDALRPGVLARDVYAQWQRVIDKAGLSHYQRHHCGYLVGIGFPPSWSGSGVPRGLRRDSDMEIKRGMVFHLMSWLLRTGEGDAFFSDTVEVTDTGAEFLTRAPRDLMVR